MNIRHLSARLLIALTTFLVGIASVSVWLFHHYQPAAVVDSPAQSEEAAAPPARSGLCSTSPVERKLEAAEAVRLAECFIAQNGYTAAPPMEDKSNLAYESIDVGPPAEKALEARRDTLEPNAYSYGKDGRHKGGWIVIFRGKYKPEYAEALLEYGEKDRETGRCVTMDAQGNHMRMEHQDCYLSSPRLTVIGHQQ